jgi:hypothetical protein
MGILDRIVAGLMVPIALLVFDNTVEQTPDVSFAQAEQVQSVEASRPDDNAAVRIGQQVQVTPLPEPAPAAGLNGLPFAPEHLTGCEEFDFYRAQVGLPERFNGIAWRESNCRNEPGVRTFCCHGYLQLYVDMHLKDHRLAPLYADCGITAISDINQNTPLSKQKQLCGAAALYSVAGISAWSATS